MIILYFHLQVQYKYELFHINSQKLITMTKASLIQILISFGNKNYKTFKWVIDLDDESLHWDF